MSTSGTAPSPPSDLASVWNFLGTYGQMRMSWPAPPHKLQTMTSLRPSEQVRPRAPSLACLEPRCSVLPVPKPFILLKLVRKHCALFNIYNRRIVTAYLDHIYSLVIITACLFTVYLQHIYSHLQQPIYSLFTAYYLQAYYSLPTPPHPTLTDGAYLQPTCSLLVYSIFTAYLQPIYSLFTSLLFRTHLFTTAAYIQFIYSMFVYSIFTAHLQPTYSLFTAYLQPIYKPTIHSLFIYIRRIFAADPTTIQIIS